MRSLAKRYKMGNTTMRTLISKDLKMKSRAVITKNRISQRQKETRLSRCKMLLNWMKSNGNKVRIFSDEKLFTVDPVLNRRNSRYISGDRAEEVDPAIKYSPKTKHPAKIMMLGVVASDGKKCPPVFTPANEKIDSEKYMEMLERHVLPWLRRTYPAGNYVFQQDGAPAHTSKKTQDFLKSKMPAVWLKSMWPPSSPDLNPLDYSIWAHVEAEACSNTRPNLESLKAAITRSWKRMEEEYVQRVCSSFRVRVDRVVRAGGDYIE